MIQKPMQDRRSSRCLRPLKALKYYVFYLSPFHLKAKIETFSETLKVFNLRRGVCPKYPTRPLPEYLILTPFLTIVIKYCLAFRRFLRLFWQCPAIICHQCAILLLNSSSTDATSRKWHRREVKHFSFSLSSCLTNQTCPLVYVYLHKRPTATFPLCTP